MAIKQGQTAVLATTGVISTAGKAAKIWAITLIGGTSDSSIIIKDGGTSGTERWKVSWNAVTNAGDVCVNVSFPNPIICTTDAYGTLAGTSAAAYVLFDEIA
jgi:hypothetical protein